METDGGGRRADEAETLLRDAAALARKRGMPAFELWCLLDLSRLLGPSRPDPAAAARVAELSHLQDLERRAAEAFRLHGYGGGRRAEFGARRPEHAPRGEPDGTRRRAPDA